MESPLTSQYYTASRGSIPAEARAEPLAPQTIRDSDRLLLVARDILLSGWWKRYGLVFWTSRCVQRYSTTTQQRLPPHARPDSINDMINQAFENQVSASTRGKMSPFTAERLKLAYSCLMGESN